MQKKVTLNDKTFKLMIPYESIDQKITALAQQINHDYRDKQTPIFLGVLSGSFMFMADLMKQIDFNCEITFIKIASYVGTSSVGKVTELIGLNNVIEGRDIIIVEDIVDTGESINHLMKSLVGHKPASIEVATLFLKPGSYKKNHPIKYRAMDIGNEFIVGFGLDYNQLGRNLKDIYVLDEQ